MSLIISQFFGLFSSFLLERAKSFLEEVLLSNRASFSDLRYSEELITKLINNQDSLKNF